MKRELAKRGRLKADPSDMPAEPAFYESLSGRPLVANITNTTSFTVPLLLAFLFLLPHAGVLARRYGWIASASEDHQRDYARESSSANAHSIRYKRSAPRLKEKTRQSHFWRQAGAFLCSVLGGRLLRFTA